MKSREEFEHVQEEETIPQFRVKEIVKRKILQIVKSLEIPHDL
jgi:hypothetical protein